MKDIITTTHTTRAGDLPVEEITIEKLQEALDDMVRDGLAAKDDAGRYFLLPAPPHRQGWIDYRSADSVAQDPAGMDPWSQCKYASVPVRIENGETLWQDGCYDIADSDEDADQGDRNAREFETAVEEAIQSHRASGTAPAGTAGAYLWRYRVEETDEKPIPFFGHLATAMHRDESNSNN